MKFVVIFMLLSFSREAVSYGNISICRQLYYDLMYYYDKDVRPLELPNNMTYVGLRLYLQTVQDLDEVKQTFSFGAAFALFWNDTSMMWKPWDYGGVWHVEISYDRVWTPDFVLTTPSKEAIAFGQSWQKVSYTNYGESVWLTIGLVQSTCEVNSRRYPFDTHVCTAEFMIWGYTIHEIEFVPDSTEVDLSFYRPSGSWELLKTSITTSSINYLEWPQMEVTLYLKRKAGFVMINVLGPVFILNLLNLLVFLLVPESGERVSYCLTVLLAISVFLTIVNENLPQNSEPMPLISYKLMIDLVSSALITAATILNLKIYHTSDEKPIPRWLTHIYLRMSYKSKQTYSGNKIGVKVKKESIGNISGNSVKSFRKESLMVTPEIDRKFEMPPEVETPNEFTGRRVDNDVRDLSWVEISHMMDYIFLIIFSMAFFLSSFIYIVLVTT